MPFTPSSGEVLLVAQVIARPLPITATVIADDGQRYIIDVASDEQFDARVGNAVVLWVNAASGRVIRWKRELPANHR